MAKDTNWKGEVRKPAGGALVKSGEEEKQVARTREGRFADGNKVYPEDNLALGRIATKTRGKHFRTLFREAMKREARRRGVSLVDHIVEWAYEDKQIAMLLAKALIEPQKPGTAISVEVENKIAMMQQQLQGGVVAGSSESVKPPDSINRLSRRAREHFRVVLEEMRENTQAVEGDPTENKALAPAPDPIADIGMVEAVPVKEERKR